MARSRFIARDEDLHIPIGGRKDLGHTPRVPGLRGSSRAGQSAVVKAVVKVAYMPAARARRYAHYIQHDGSAGPVSQAEQTAAAGYSSYIGRDGAGQGGTRAELFTRAFENPAQEPFLQRCFGDMRAWTIIISPGRNGLDMTRYVREFMRQIEIDLRRPLDWIAATHYDTPHTHSHILMRGRDRDGKDFRIPPHYIAQDLRRHATNIATRAVELGWVRQVHTVDQSRVASLQRQLAQWMTRHVKEGHER